MKTVKINDDLFQRAEKLAVERGLSVDDLVSDLVAKVTGGETPEAYRARMEMVEMARKATGGLGAGSGIARSSIRTNVFLDTNVLIYAATAMHDDPRKHAIAMDIIASAPFVVSVQVMAEFVSVVVGQRHPGSPRTPSSGGSPDGNPRSTSLDPASSAAVGQSPPTTA